MNQPAFAGNVPRAALPPPSSVRMLLAATVSLRPTIGSAQLHSVAVVAAEVDSLPVDDRQGWLKTGGQEGGCVVGQGIDKVVGVVAHWRQMAAADGCKPRFGQRSLGRSERANHSGDRGLGPG